ncbi:MAG: hypothetical protein AAGK97_13095 [Bacteroidota bacterium]
MPNEDYDPGELLSSPKGKSWMTIFLMSLFPGTFYVLCMNTYLLFKEKLSGSYIGKIVLAYFFNVIILVASFCILNSMNYFIIFILFASILAASYCTFFTIGFEIEQAIIIQVFFLHFSIAAFCLSIGFVINEPKIIFLWNFLASLAIVPVFLDSKFYKPLTWVGVGLIFTAIVIALS